MRKQPKTDYHFNSLPSRGDLEGQQGESPQFFVKLRTLRKEREERQWIFVFLGVSVPKKTKGTLRDYKCHEDTKAQRFTKERQWQTDCHIIPTCIPAFECLAMTSETLRVKKDKFRINIP